MAVYRSRMRTPIAVACKIREITITEADNAACRYTGEIGLFDYGEDSRANYGWRAQPGTQEHEVFGKRYCMDIEPAKPFWGEHMFTLQPDIDRDVRHHIMNAILDYNPSLPQAK